VRPIALLALAGLAAGASAQPYPADTELRYEVRHYDPGTNAGWASFVAAIPGDRIEVRAVVNYLGTGTVGGLGQITFRPVLTNWTGNTLLTNGILGSPGMANGIGPYGGSRSTPLGTVDDLPGVYGRLSPWGANATSTTTFLRGHLGTGTATGMIRIAQAHITNWIGEGASSGPTANNNRNGGGGVNTVQISNPNRLSTDPPFDSRSTGLVAFKFSFIVGGEPGRLMDLFTPDGTTYNGFGQVIAGGQSYPSARWFATPDEQTPSVFTAPFTTPAQVFIGDIPSPGPPALILLGIAGLGRRDRRSRQP
jgi:hypothetical protein